MKTKTISAIIIVGLVIIFGVYQGFIQKGKPAFTLAEVNRGTVFQEVSETGQVQKGEEISLSFKNAGKIEKIFVKVGDKVLSKEVLAKLETDSLEIQLREAQAALAVAQAQLDKLLAGASLEEIKIAQTEIESKQTSLEIAKENLNQAFEDALNILDDSYLKLYNAYTTVDSIQKTYFNINDQESIKVKDSKESIESAMSRAKSYLDIAKNDSKNENIDTALSEMKKSLDTTSKDLTAIRELCETPVCQNKVSSTDKTSLDTQRTNINTALTNITNSQQTISSMKLSVTSAENQLEEAKGNLTKLTAEPRKEDIDLYQAQIKQADAKVDLIKNQIKEATITSPTDGQITKIGKREGEIVQSGLIESVISLLPTSHFQIKVDIYEEDIVKINVGNSVDITLTAYPDKILKGKAVSIDPTEKLIEGVVYYETTINFEEIGEEIKPGMTADVVIKTAFKENVLTIPKNALQKKDDKNIVEVFKSGQIEKREIKTGLLGSNDMIEIISGLKEGEVLVIR